MTTLLQVIGRFIILNSQNKKYAVALFVYMSFIDGKLHVAADNIDALKDLGIDKDKFKKIISVIEKGIHEVMYNKESEDDAG